MSELGARASSEPISRPVPDRRSSRSVRAGPDTSSAELVTDPDAAPPNRPLPESCCDLLLLPLDLHRNSLITMLLYTDALVGDELISDAYDVSQSLSLWISVAREGEQRASCIASLHPRAKAASPRKQEAGSEALGTRTRVREPRWATAASRDRE